MSAAPVIATVGCAPLHNIDAKKSMLGSPVVQASLISAPDRDRAVRPDGRDRARDAARRDRRQPDAPAREMGTASSRSRRGNPAF